MARVPDVMSKTAQEETGLACNLKVIHRQLLGLTK
jgi:hypothetical protein